MNILDEALWLLRLSLQNGRKAKWLYVDPTAFDRIWLELAELRHTAPVRTANEPRDWMLFGLPLILFDFQADGYMLFSERRLH